MSEISKKYDELKGAAGFLGKPTTPEEDARDGIGRYRHYKGGSIFWHPFTGAREVHGLIRTKWAKLGWERSSLGYPKTDESETDAGGRYNLFQGGAILWKNGAKEAFETHGAIRSKHGQHGFEKGFLGFPISDEKTARDKVGRYNHFENGSIFWKPTIGAHEVHGLIRKLWAEKDWGKGALGYPISDELPSTKGSKSRFTDFENGVVHWKYGASKAVSLKPLVIQDKASQKKDEVMAKISELIVPTLKSNARVYIKSGPSLAEVTDYSFDGSVHNRQYRVRTRIGIDVSGVPDPTTELDLWVSIAYVPASRSVVGSLDRWWAHAHVPWPTSIGLDASEVIDQLAAAIKPELGKPHVVASVPAGINLLSLKVMKDGDLNLYIEP